ncbi:hypothetical protein Tco_0826011 [Tanacetum coccineum]
MTTTAAQQVALDNALVPLEKRVKIGKCNIRIDPAKTQKEPTYQVVFYALALTTCYPALLITADVLEIYMHQFWFIINKKDYTSYKFKIDKKRFSLSMEVFKEIFQICPNLLNQEFDALPSDEEIVSFIKELGHKGDIKSITEVVVDHMYQPWRTFAAIINKCLSRKITDFTFQKENRDHKKQEKMYYPRFTKAIIHHFITKDKSTLMRNKMFMNTARDDSILGPMRFVSKSDDFQVYGALLPNRMTNQQMLDSDAYKTYLAYATGEASPKMKRKFKKPASPSKKRTLVTIEEEEPEPAKKVKKAPTKAERSKGIELLYDAALLKEAQLKKAFKRSKRDTNIHQAGGSSEGADFESNVLDEPKGKSNDTSEGTGLKLVVPDVSKADSFESEYESWGDSGDEANVQDDEEVQESDDEPQHADDERTNYENQETNDDEEETEDKLTDDEPDDEDKGDKEMTNAKSKDVENANVIQESVGNLVKDDARATPKTEGPIPSSSISSNYAAKYLNFDNIPPVEIEVVSMLDINLQQSTLIPTPTRTKATPSTTVVSESKTLTVLQLRRLVERLRRQNAPRSKSVEDIREIKKEHVRKQQVPKETITSSDTTTLAEFDQKTTLFEKMTKSKSFNKSLKQRALYHALMESILEDEDVMIRLIYSTGHIILEKTTGNQRDNHAFVNIDPKDRFKKPERTSYPDPEWKKGFCKEAIADGGGSYNGIQMLEADPKVIEIIPFELSKPVPLVMSGNRQIIPVDYLFNNDLAYLQEESTDRTYTTSLTKTKAAKYDLPGIEYMVPNLWSPVKVAYDNHALLGTSHWGPKRQSFYGYASNMVSIHDVYSTKRILAVTNVKVKEWYVYVHLEEIEVRRSDQQLYKFMEGDFPRLHLHDIEDMLILLVQNKLFNLKGDVD